jgi:hypothetical protein
MKISPDALESHGFAHQDTLEHQDLIPFVQKYLKKPTVSSRLYTAANLLLFAALVANFVYQNGANEITIGTGLTFSSFGISIAFLLIPLHEFIHVLAYKYVGAERTSYDVNWKKFYFMALADRFVADRKEFKIVALAPFITITSLGLMALLLTSAEESFIPLSTILVHSAFCGGDFGILSYFDFHKDKTVVTYDDISTGKSYFLTQNKNG